MLTHLNSEHAQGIMEFLQKLLGLVVELQNPNNLNTTCKTFLDFCNAELQNDFYAVMLPLFDKMKDGANLMSEVMFKLKSIGQRELSSWFTARNLTAFPDCPDECPSPGCPDRLHASKENVKIWEQWLVIFFKDASGKKI